MSDNFWIYSPFLTKLAVGNYGFGIGNDKSISKILYSKLCSGDVGYIHRCVTKLAVGNYGFGLGNDKSISKILYSKFGAEMLDIFLLKIV